MTYEPLHHKYRPQTFAELVGQEAIATTLTNAIRTERIAPAYLFTGSRGTGKTSSARILAKSLNCLKSNKPTEQPCGVCDVCQGIAKGSTLDVIEIDAATNTGVENIRELIERAQFAPIQCRYKVYVIDECHQLSGAAFNALLKTLEEPPKQVVFVLATTDPMRVLPTIISRCQRFDFRRIALEAMVKHLREIAEKENINITVEAITLIAQVAQGGLRDAESLLDQLSLLAGVVTVERVWDLVGAVPERDLMDLLKAIASHNTEAILEKARNLMDRGREPLIVLQNLAGFYRDLLIAKKAPNRNDLVALTAPTWTALCEFAEGWNTATILKGQKHLKESEVQIKNTTQPRLWLEVTLLGLLPSADVDVRHEDATVRVIESKTSNNNRPQINRDSANTHSYSPDGHVRAYPQPEPESPSHPVDPASDALTGKVLPTQQTPQEQTSPAAPAPESRENSETSPLQAASDWGGELPKQADPVSQPAVSAREAAPEKLEVGSEATGQQPDLNQIWQKVLAYLSVSSRALFSEHGRLLALNGQEARIVIRAPKLIKMAQSRQKDIEEAFLRAFNQKVRVNLAASEPSTTSRTSADPSRRKSDFVSESVGVPEGLASAYSADAHSRKVERQEVREIGKSPNTGSPLPPSPEAKEEVNRNNWVTPSPSLIPSKVQPPERMEVAAAGSTAERIPPPAKQQAEALHPPVSKVPDWGEDEVANDEVVALRFAAQSFAEFFKAEIINLSDHLDKNVETVNLQSLPEPAANHTGQLEEMTSPAAEIELEDDDIPF